MSQWGNLDRLETHQFAMATTGSSILQGNTGGFTVANGFVVGYSVIIANVAYRMNTITNSNTLILEVPFTGSNINANLAVQQSPKDLLTYGWGNVTTGANTTNKRNVFGVDAVEVAAKTNKDKGFSQPGWTTHRAYRDTQGNQRYKTEVLVAMSKNFNENGSGTLQTDANDDATLVDYQLYFATQATNKSNVSGGNASFTVAPASAPNGAVITVQWQGSNSATSGFTNISNGGTFTGATSNTLLVANVAALPFANVTLSNVWYVRAVISSVTGNAASNISTAVSATLTT
jgi:hypothetical protein